ncbi:MAG: hypothetical protein H6828_11440 [Planctomycetes bacterium]|nr:hypothetical protein [Planctomycetota bacterium]
MRLARRLLALLLLAFVGGCCVTPPNAEEVLNTGFRSPEQCVRTFQLAMRGDLARLEYRCFSVDFQSRIGGQLAYREFRARELASQPWFQQGVARAEVVRSEPLGPLRHRVVVETRAFLQTWRIEVLLVREDAWQAWAGDELLADELLPPAGFRDNVDVSVVPGGPPALVAVAELSPDLARRDPAELRRSITEVRIAQEWKIDDLRELEDLDEAPDADGDRSPEPSTASPIP